MIYAGIRAVNAVGMLAEADRTEKQILSLKTIFFQLLLALEPLKCGGLFGLIESFRASQLPPDMPRSLS